MAILDKDGDEITEEKKSRFGDFKIVPETLRGDTPKPEHTWIMSTRGYQSSTYRDHRLENK